MAFTGRGAAFPAGGYGYTRGSDFMAGGSGSGMGMAAQGTMKRGQGLGPLGQVAGQWEPGPLYLIALLIAEMVAVHILGRLLS